MPHYRIHRLKDRPRRQFLQSPHVGGQAWVKPRDYEPDAEIDAASPYAAFFALRDTATPLVAGDLLETPDGALRIFKFIGFEEAQWVTQDPQAAEEPAVVEAVD
jgi:hypothetical protein